MNLCDKQTIFALLNRHGFHFSKSMGQNFLIDANIPRSIAEASGADEHCGVLEIGPGIGSMTVELARQAGKVVSVELDKSLLPILDETLTCFSNTKVISGDVLNLDLPALVDEEFSDLRPVVCANLPYNITTPILSRLIEADCFESITVMIQKEVAQRICAEPESGKGGAFSLFLQYYMVPEYCFDVPRDSFYPAPKVTSAVIRCTRRSQPAVAVSDETFFFRTIKGGFALRRKTLPNSLASVFSGQLDKNTITEAILECGLSPTVRGERLTLQNYADLADSLRKRLR